MRNLTILALAGSAILAGTVAEAQSGGGFRERLRQRFAQGVRQAEALAAALRKAGTAVELGSFPGRGLTGHLEIDRRLGDPGYPATARVGAWLKAVFGM